MKGYKNLIEFLDAPGSVGLVVGGGGMRGVITSAMLAVLLEAGYGERFNIATGSSSGATHIAYFMTGQSETGVRMYLNDLPDSEFINYRRLRRIMDIQILEDMMSEGPETKLDIKKLKAHPMKSLVPLTSVNKYAQVVFNLKEAEDPVHVLCAGMSIPVLDNEVRKINGDQYVDGGVSDILPLHLIDGKCDRILVLRSDTKQNYKVHKFLYGVVSHLVHHLTFKKGMAIPVISSQNKRRSFKRMEKDDVFVIHPPKNHQVSRATRDKEKIKEAHELTVAMMCELLA